MQSLIVPPKYSVSFLKTAMTHDKYEWRIMIWGCTMYDEICKCSYENTYLIARHYPRMIHLWGLLRYTMSSTGSPARLRYTIQYIRWKVMNMMGKMTRLYLSMSLARIPNSRVGGWGGSAGVARGRRGARVLSSLHTCPVRSVLSRGNVSTPSLTVHVSMQHVWNRTQAWNTVNILDYRACPFLRYSCSLNLFKCFFFI